MARILYFPTHEPLEYDEINLFRSMGHVVFSLGRHCPAQSEPTFRPPIVYDDDETAELVSLFRSEGCSARFMTIPELTTAFLNAFDVIISIQDPNFIIRYWAEAHRGPAWIWRTVGQAIEHFDAAVAPYRDQGLRIVRWSAREAQAKIYVGHDAIIRAYKDPLRYGEWTGEDGRIITFSNDFRQRYPIEQGLFERILHDIPYAVGGAGNDGIKNALGLLSIEDQAATMRGASGYLYCHGSTVPYTLNFIEAWMTGVPVVAARKDVEIVNIDMRFNEINDFIVDGETGFLFKSEGQAWDVCRQLVADPALGARVGAAGREMAMRFFGRDRAAHDWQMLFDAIRC